jgi:hypothetical protein
VTLTPSAARGFSRTAAGDVIEGFAWTYDRNGNPLSRPPQRHPRQ